MSKQIFNMDILDKALLAQLDEYINTLEDKKGNLIHILHRGQELFGYLPKELQLHVARKADVPAATVNGVVSFYSYFTQEPAGKYTVSVCMGTACYVKGAEQIIKDFREKAGVEGKNMSDDGLFTVRDVRCIGACGLAPVVTVNEKVYGHVKPEDVDKIIEACRKEEI